MPMAVCFHLDLNYLDYSDKVELDRFYQNGLKKLLKVLYVFPDFLLSISLPGAVLEYYNEKFPEAIELLKEIVARSQVEFLGGGFFSPILPLLQPSDRSGQIEKMTSLLRVAIGKRPRGISLYGSIWNGSLIQSIKACGFEYVFLDEGLAQNYGTSVPLIVSDYGKSIKVLLTKKYSAPMSDENFDSWRGRVLDSALDSLLCVELDMEQALHVADKKFLSELLSYNGGNILSTPMLYLKSCPSYRRAFIGSGMKKNPSSKKNYATIHDYLFDNPESMHLYERIVYIGMLISQSHGKDKMRKKAAQEKLWEAQCGSFLISPGNGGAASPRGRQTAYKLLNEAERCLRESGQFIEVLTSFDYNSDGFSEYVYQAEHFNAVISPVGGRVCDLNILSSGVNYTDSLASRESFMVETLSEREPDKILSSENDLYWGDILFAEKKFDSKRKDILLESEGIFSQLKMPVSLQKKIVVSSSGLMIQYILKNLSPFQLKAYFSVSLGLSQTDFQKGDGDQFDLELIQDGNRIVPQKDRCVLKKGVSMLQIIDKSGKMTMLFEPNEEAGFVAGNETPKDADRYGRIQNIRFYWPIDLASGRAMEKTVNFMLIPTRKGR